MNNKILSKIKIAVNKYSDYLSACDKIAREASKHIDWNDSVSCEYYPADGICIEIEEHVCSIFTFSELVEESENGMIDKRTYISNCI